MGTPDLHQYCAGLKITESLCNHKATILVCMILNGKGSSNWLWSTWAQSCFCYFFKQVNLISSCFQTKYFALVSSVACLLFLYIIVEQRKRRGDHIKCELIGGGLLDIFSNLFIVAVHYTHSNTRSNLCTSTCLNPVWCWTSVCRVSLQLLTVLMYTMLSTTK